MPRSTSGRFPRAPMYPAPIAHAPLREAGVDDVHCCDGCKALHGQERHRGDFQCCALCARAHADHAVSAINDRFDRAQAGQ